MSTTTVDNDTQLLNYYIELGERVRSTASPEFLDQVVEERISVKPGQRSVQESSILCTAIKNPNVSSRTLAAALGNEMNYPDRDETVCRMINHILTNRDGRAKIRDTVKSKDAAGWLNRQLRGR